MNKDDYEIKHRLREEWLEEAAEMMRPEFEAAGSPLPEKVRVACGFPSRGGLAKKRRVLGECWHDVAAPDKVCQIYISPLDDMPDEVFSTLRHELMHTVTKKGHGPDFKALGKKMGMEGKPKEMRACQEVMDHFREHQLPRLGWYPHVRLEPKEEKKKQNTRMLKIFCDGVRKREDGSLDMSMVHDDYVVRAAQKTIDRGLPICPVCETDMKLEEDD